jgi:hypothetical protein
MTVTVLFRTQQSLIKQLVLITKLSSTKFTIPKLCPLSEPLLRSPSHREQPLQQLLLPLLSLTPGGQQNVPPGPTFVQVMGPRGRARKEVNLSTISKILTKFSGKNFQSWKMRTRHVLKSYKLIGIVDGTEIEPVPMDYDNLSPEEEEIVSEWHTANETAVTILGMALDDTLFVTFMDSENANEIWNKLSHRYDVNTTYDRHEIHHKLSQKEGLAGKTVSQHIDSLTSTMA